MPLKDALICAYAFDASGQASVIDSDHIDGARPDTGWLWIHLDRSHDATEAWLRDSANLDPLVIEALLEEETRPRCAAIGDGRMVILRGVNLNVGANPEDMVSIRVWIDSKRVISLRRRKVMAIQDLRDGLDRGDGPTTPGGLLIDITGFMIDRVGPVLGDLDDAVDQIEEDVLEAPGHALRLQLSRLRRQAISLRRFLAPQREVISQLQNDRSEIFSDMNRGRLREIADRLTRSIEELDAARDRAAITHEELAGRIADQMNRNMYALSIVAGIFLPLGLLTGLLGINVGGMPGVENDWAFAIVCVILVLLAGLVLWIFRKLHIM
ncbi:MAG: zinc transporter ZntB [Planctomycetota bacterium]|jgi:zinc transporter